MSWDIAKTETLGRLALQGASLLVDGKPWAFKMKYGSVGLILGLGIGIGIGLNIKKPPPQDTQNG